MLLISHLIHYPFCYQSSALTIQSLSLGAGFHSHVILWPLVLPVLSQLGRPGTGGHRTHRTSPRNPEQQKPKLPRALARAVPGHKNAPAVAKKIMVFFAFSTKLKPSQKTLFFNRTLSIPLPYKVIHIWFYPCYLLFPNCNAILINIFLLLNAAMNFIKLKVKAATAGLSLWCFCFCMVTLLSVWKESK